MTPHILTPLDTLPERAEPLSPAARARRDAMLPALERRVRARPARRAALATGAAIAPVLVIAAVALATIAPTRTAPTRTGPTPIAAEPTDAPPSLTPSPTAPSHPSFVAAAMTPPPAVHRLAAYVAADDDALERYTVHAGAPVAEIIGDAELLTELRSAGVPAGLVRTHDRVTLALHTPPSNDATP